MGAAVNGVGNINGNSGNSKKRERENAITTNKRWKRHKHRTHIHTSKWIGRAWKKRECGERDRIKVFVGQRFIYTAASHSKCAFECTRSSTCVFECACMHAMYVTTWLVRERERESVSASERENLSCEKGNHKPSLGIISYMVHVPFNRRKEGEKRPNGWPCDVMSESNIGRLANTHTRNTCATAPTHIHFKWVLWIKSE